METSFTRVRAELSVPRGCLVGALLVNFTGGCVRELTGLTFEALPGDSSAVTSDAASTANVVNDAAVFDALVPHTFADAHSGESSASNGLELLDAEVSQVDGGDDGIALPIVDAGATSSYARDASVVDSGAGSVARADAGATALGERWVFQVASPFATGDAGVGLVPIFPARELVVDGSNAEWSDEGWLWIATPDVSVGEPLSEHDLSAALAVRWDATKLYLVVTVLDDRHVNDASGFDIWGGDSIQVAFDLGQGRSPYDWEYGFAKTSAGLTAHRWREGDADVTSDMEFAVVRHRAATVYEVAFAPRHLGVAAFPTETLRLSVAVNDNDDQERSAALELVQGIVGTKSSAHFAAAEWQQ